MSTDQQLADLDASIDRHVSERAVLEAKLGHAKLTLQIIAAQSPCQLAKEMAQSALVFIGEAP